jgi:hypothetical protein
VRSDVLVSHRDVGTPTAVRGPRHDEAVAAAGHTTGWFRQAAWLFGLLTAAFVVWLGFGLGGAKATTAVDDIGELVAALVAATACAVASRRVEDARAGWILMALSSLVWAAGEAVWCYDEVFRGVDLPYPSLADAGFLTSVPLALLGLRRLFPDPAPSSRSPVCTLLAGLLLAPGAFIIVWAATLRPGAAVGGLAQELIGLAYPAADLVLATVILTALRRGAGDQTTMRLVLAGILAFTVADSSFAVLTTFGDYGIGYTLDAGWVLGYFLLALGALWALQQAESPTNRWRGGPPGHAEVAGPASLVPGWAFPLSLGKRHWLARARAEHIVGSTTVLLIVADAGVVLYDLARILTALARPGL